MEHRNWIRLTEISAIALEDLDAFQEARWQLLQLMQAEEETAETESVLQLLTILAETAEPLSKWIRRETASSAPDFGALLTAGQAAHLLTGAAKSAALFVYEATRHTSDRTYAKQANSEARGQAKRVETLLHLAGELVFTRITTL